MIPNFSYFSPPFYKRPPILSSYNSQNKYYPFNQNVKNNILPQNSSSYSNLYYNKKKLINSKINNNDYLNFSNTSYNTNNCNHQNNHSIEDLNVQITNEELKQSEIFEIFGLKLYFDDLLLICLIFFLYNEGVKDYYLFISLILLLLS